MPGPSGELRRKTVARDAPISHKPLGRLSSPTFAPVTTIAPQLAASTTAPIRAVAVAHEQSNAVGTVELSCSAAGLQLTFVRISAYTDGYVPYPSTLGQRVTVPYEQVARVTIDGDGLVHLTVDGSCTPFNKLVLAGLVRDRAFDHVTSHRRRAKIEQHITMSALVAWMPIALTLRAVLPDLSALIAFGISATVSGMLYTMRRDMAAKLVLFSRSSERVRDELLDELRYRLAPGRVQHAGASELPVPGVAPAEPGEAEAAEAGSLKGLFATAGVVAAAAAVAILVGKNLLFSDTASREPPWGHDTEEAWSFANSDDTATTASNGVVASSAIRPDPTPVLPPPPSCSCDRADSPLWADGIPRMSILSRNRPGKTSPERPSMYPEIAVVNNSSEDLKDIVMVVDFLLGPRDGRKARVVDKQDLFWEGKLAPGRAVKWRVRGRGDDFSVTSFVSGSIGDESIAPAPSDAFYKLSMTANTPAVRLHGTTMLAYLGDARVREAIDKLRAEGREDMADALEKLDLASRPLRVCSVRATPDATKQGTLNVQACVFNASKAVVPAPTVTARAALGDQVREARWGLRADLDPGNGALATGTVEAPTAEEGTDPGAMAVRVSAEP